MRLYLSSHGLGNHVDRLIAMVGDNKKVLYIDNAKDYVLPEERAMHVEEKKDEFETAGFEFEELDLRDYFGKQSELSQVVAKAGLIWGGGGNTFILRRAMSQSGLTDILTAGIKNDQFVYGGSSAGSIVMTKTLRGIENADNPYMVPDGYETEIIWTGVGLVYPQLVPHYHSQWPAIADKAEAMADYFESKGLKYVTLEDGDVYVVEGGFEDKLT